MREVVRVRLDNSTMHEWSETTACPTVISSANCLCVSRPLVSCFCLNIIGMCPWLAQKLAKVLMPRHDGDISQLRWLYYGHDSPRLLLRNCWIEEQSSPSEELVWCSCCRYGQERQTLPGADSREAPASRLVERARRHSFPTNATFQYFD